MEHSKSIFVSKTMWYNFVWVVLILLNRFLLPVPMEILEPLAVISLPIGNAIIRYFTTKGVKVWGS